MSLYWVIFVLCTSLGLGIPALLIWKLVIEEILMFIKRKKSNIKPRRLKNRGSITKFSLTSIFGVFFGLTMLLGISVLSLWIVTPYWLDLPQVITGKYAIAHGVLDKYEYVEKDSRSWGYNYSVKIDSVIYQAMKRSNVFIGDKVIFEYLPHTKVILEIKPE